MKSDYPVMLDACVLLPMPLADTLLRMAETPRLYLPKWSDETLNEITRNLLGKWNKTQEQAGRRETVMRQYFPESLVEGYEDLTGAMKNDPKDRHVLAAAVMSGTKLIVTFNTKHFPQESLEPYGIERYGPSTFLIGLYDLEPGIVSVKLTEQAQAIGISLKDLLRKLRVNVPGFVSFFCEEQKIDLNDLG
jgi:predicted nucleic acid-binding protein